MKNHAKIKSYVIGFILSLILTLIPYYLVINFVLSSEILIVTIMGFALLQLLVQLIFFLHLGRESKPRWNLIMLISTFGVVLIVVIGSLWIMDHLNYNMTPDKMEKQIIEKEGIHK